MKQLERPLHTHYCFMLALYGHKQEIIKIFSPSTRLPRDCVSLFKKSLFHLKPGPCEEKPELVEMSYPEHSANK